MNMEIDEIKKLNIPKGSGCYLFRDAQGVIIYIGKAANLKSRVMSYWQKSANHSPAKAAMMKQAANIEIIETDTEIEALLLEANLIKKYQPSFNVMLRDDKRFAYIKVSTEEEWARVFLTRAVTKAGRYFGPFTNTEAVRETLRVLRRIWPYRTCRNLPQKACLYYRIGKCPGVCENKIDGKGYGKIIKQIILFLEGRKKQIVKDLEKEIKSGEKSGEDVRQLKYRLLNMKKVLENAKIIGVSEKYAADVVELAKTLGLARIPERIEGYDISNIFGQEAVGSMVVFAGGEPDKNEYRKFKIRISEGEANDTGMITEILERRFNNDWPCPDLIIVDGGKAQLNAALRTIKKGGLNIPAIAVSKGEGLRSAAAPDKIFFPAEKTPLVLPIASPALHIIKRVRDEAHRFAIKYHRKLRSRKKFSFNKQKI